MKQISKIMAILTAFIILVSMLVLPVNAAKSVVFSASSASGKQGDIVTISAKVSSGVKLEGCHIILTYDTTQLQYVEGSNKRGNIYNDEGFAFVNRSGNQIKCSAKLDPTKSVNGGTVFSVQFKILASSGTSIIKVSSDGGANNCDENLNAVGYSVSNGKVTVNTPVTGISLNTTSVSLKKGGTAQLTATVSPSDATNKTVTYSSSNSKVATVTSGGKITAVGGGTATITAKAGGKSATCKVTVSVAQTGIKTSGGTERTVGLNSTLRLSVAKVPADATDSYSVTWSSSDTNIATVSSNGTVTGVALGTATITAKSNGWTATYKVTVVEKAEESSSDASSEESSSDVSETETETTELTSTEAVTESTTAASNTEKGFFAKLKSFFSGGKNEDSGNNSTESSKSGVSSFFSGLIKKLNDKNNTVTKFYHYCMVAAASAVMAAITIPVTAIITSSIYKNKMKKNGNNTNNTEQR